MADIEVAPADEFPPGSFKLVVAGAGEYVGVYNCGGSLYAIEDRGSHADRPLREGGGGDSLRRGGCGVSVARVCCPGHGSAFHLGTGRPLSFPAHEPVATYPVEIVDGTVRL